MLYKRMVALAVLLLSYLPLVFFFSDSCVLCNTGIKLEAREK